MIFDLYEALYDPNRKLPQDHEFYVETLEDIEYFGISSQTYFLLQQTQLWSLTPQFFQVRLEKNCRETVYRNMLIKNQTEFILKELEKNKIETIPLKGTVFAEHYFGHFGARWTSDIDLLVRYSDMKRTIECIMNMGFTAVDEQIQNHFHLSLIKPIPGSHIPLIIELHWDILKDKTSNLKISDFWKQAKPYKAYHYIKCLSGRHTLYLICLHGWRHNLNSLKYFIDIIQTIHVLHDTLDYSALLEEAKSHKTLKRVIWSLAVVYHYFPHLEQIIPFPLPGKIKIKWDYQAIRDHRHKRFKQYLNLFYSQYLIFDSVKHALPAVMSSLLPTRTEMAQELNSRKGEGFIINEYLRLYKKRTANILNTILHYKNVYHKK